MRHEFHSIKYHAVQHNATRAIIDKAWHMMKGTSRDIQDPAVRQMLDDYDARKGEKGSEGGKEDKNDSESKKERTHGQDPISDEAMAYVSVAYVQKDPEQAKTQESGEPHGTDQHQNKDGDEDDGILTERENWSQFKHHQFVKRWGLFDEKGGEDEPWWIETPLAMDEDDDGYLCEMCRHINWKILLNQRGLPGNTSPGTNQIHVYALDRLLTEERCSLCRLVRQSFIRDGLLENNNLEDLVGEVVQFGVVDAGPDSALRLQVSPFEILPSHMRDFPPTVIQWIAEEDNTTPFRGLGMQGAKADLTRLRNWLQTALEDNSFVGEPDTPISPTSPSQLRIAALGLGEQDHELLRFIDLDQNCIVMRKRDCRYACLSYVWGGFPQIKFTSETRHVLETQQGLEHGTIHIPLTIRDAMTVTQGAGLRYLWVDSLCVVQDDADDVARNVAQMDDIYSQAVLTIVASTNQNPTQGLPGVSEVHRSREQIIANVQGMRLAVALHPPERGLGDIQDSIWNSRAWTYQEQQLSRNVVYLTDTEMVFTCPQGTFFEDTVPRKETIHDRPLANTTQFTSETMEIQMHVWQDSNELQFPNKSFETEDGVTTFIARDPKAEGEDTMYKDPAPRYKITQYPKSKSLGKPVSSSDTNFLTIWDTYVESVDNYTRRGLSVDADIIRAFTGMQTLIARGVNTEFWYGIPEFELDQALLWYPKEPLTRRPKPNDWRRPIPSWTWAGWKGNVSYRGAGWRNTEYPGPISVLQWEQRMPREVFLRRMPVDPKSQRPMAEILEENDIRHIKQALDPDRLFRISHSEGWEKRIHDVTNKYIYNHPVYPGINFRYPAALPEDTIPTRPDWTGVLYFKTSAVPVQLANIVTPPPPKSQSSAESVNSPPTTTAEGGEEEEDHHRQDSFIQIGINDEYRSSNYRPPWKRILYHQGYRCGFLVLNIPFSDLESDLLPGGGGGGRSNDDETNDNNNNDQEPSSSSSYTYILASHSRDSLPNIPCPPGSTDPGRQMYERFDPVAMQDMIHYENRRHYDDDAHWLESWKGGDASPPDTSSRRENGDPHWDEGRFGGLPQMLLPVYNVLLLRKKTVGSERGGKEEEEEEGKGKGNWEEDRDEEDMDMCWERVGVGKVHFHAFHLAGSTGLDIRLR